MGRSESLAHALLLVVNVATQNTLSNQDDFVSASPIHRSLFFDGQGAVRLICVARMLYDEGHNNAS